MKTFFLATNTNSPAGSWVYCEVIQETEKALKVKNDSLRHSFVWLPKSALKPICQDAGIQDAFTFADWFRKLDKGAAINKVWHIFN